VTSTNQFDIRKLAALIRTKRAGRGLRSAATEIGSVSASTLSRIEQGNIPDLETFMRVIRWLGVSADEFMTSPAAGRPADALKLVEAHLRADRTLAPEAVDALSAMIRFAYKAAKTKKH
jgi:transcriptional regulator with XRE-family HTH domain